MPEKNGHDEDEPILAISVRFACSVGNNRQMELTTSTYQDWPVERMNGVVDKMATIMDRQTERYLLKDLEQAMAQAEKDINTNREQRARLENSFKESWLQAEKRGPWQPHGSQAKQLDNYSNTIEHLTTTITRLRTQIADVQARCH